MKFVFGGVRGSRPACGRLHSRYGGETTSVLVQGAAGETLIVDAGTGVLNLAARIRDGRGPVTILFSHYHMDHLIGLPAFCSLFRSRPLDFVGPAFATGGVEAAIRPLLQPPYWPVPLDAREAPASFRDVRPVADPAAVLAVGGLEIRHCPVSHPDGCVAWRVDEPATGQALVFATDAEWGLMTQAQRSAFLEFMSRPRPVDLLVMDGHFAPEEYDRHRGWGHSTHADVAEVGLAGAASRVVITHHDPAMDDDALDDRTGDLMALPGPPEFARQGMAIELRDPSSPIRDPR